MSDFLAMRFLSCRACLGLFVFVFTCDIEPGAPGRHERVCRDIVRAGGTVHGCLFFGSALPVVFFFCFVFFYLATSKEGNEDRDLASSTSNINT